MNCILTAFNDHLRYMGVEPDKAGDIVYHAAREAIGVNGMTPAFIVPMIYRAMINMAYPGVWLWTQTHIDYGGRSAFIGASHSTLEFLLTLVTDYGETRNFTVLPTTNAGILLPVEVQHARFEKSPKLDSEKLVMFIQLYKGE